MEKFQGKLHVSLCFKPNLAEIYLILGANDILIVVNTCHIFVCCRMNCLDINIGVKIIIFFIYQV